MHDKLFKVKPEYPLALLTLFEFQINLIAGRSLYLERNMPLVSLEWTAAELDLRQASIGLLFLILRGDNLPIAMILELPLFRKVLLLLFGSVNIKPVNPPATSKTSLLESGKVK